MQDLKDAPESSSTQAGKGRSTRGSKACLQFSKRRCLQVLGHLHHVTGRRAEPLKGLCWRSGPEPSRNGGRLVLSRNRNGGGKTCLENRLHEDCEAFELRALHRRRWLRHDKRCAQRTAYGPSSRSETSSPVSKRNEPKTAILWRAPS